ncbi:MAG: hypothetical protein HKN68_16840 [Saprospiraceae bacterium]|nr:hypothetical protein [Saprospiraceae bacterium]
MTSYAKYHIYFLVMIVALITSCEKAEIGAGPEVVQDTEPVFFTEIEFNGQSIMFNAGDEDFFMYTVPPDPSDSLIIYSSVAKSDDCRESCDQEFRLEVFDSPSIDLSAQEYFFPFGGGASFPQPTTGVVDFFLSSPTLDFNLFWSAIEADTPVGDSISFTIEPNQVAVLDPIIVDLNNVGLISILPANGFLNEFNCQLNIKGGVNDQGEVILSILTDTDNANTNIIWSDGSTGRQITINDATNKVSAEIIQADGCELIITFDIMDMDQITLLDLAFNLSYLPMDPELLFIPGARITYVDERSNTYQSIEAGELRVFDIEDYISNENGDQTIQYSVEFSAILMNQNNPFDIITINDGKARLATLKK